MTSPASSAPPITKTGIQGFLMWFKREQPAIYNKIAPSIPKVAPKAFSNYTARRKRLGAMYRRTFARHRVGVSGMGDYASYSLPTLYVTAPASTPVTVDYTAQLTAPTYASNPVTVDYSSQLTPSYDTSAVGNNLSTPTANVSPVASAANTGMVSTGTATAIGALIGAAAAVSLTNQQAALQQAAVQTNLTRAAAGLAPLNTSLNALGVPTVASSSDGGTLLLLGGAAILLVLMMGGSKSV
jgi:hypothetical protein